MKSNLYEAQVLLRTPQKTSVEASCKKTAAEMAVIDVLRPFSQAEVLTLKNDDIVVEVRMLGLGNDDNPEGVQLLPNPGNWSTWYVRIIPWGRSWATTSWALPEDWVS